MANQNEMVIKKMACRKCAKDLHPKRRGTWRTVFQAPSYSPDLNAKFPLNQKVARYVPSPLTGEGQDGGELRSQRLRYFAEIKYISPFPSVTMNGATFYQDYPRTKFSVFNPVK